MFVFLWFSCGVLMVRIMVLKLNCFVFCIKVMVMFLFLYIFYIKWYKFNLILKLCNIGRKGVVFVNV